MGPVEEAVPGAYLVQPGLSQDPLGACRKHLPREKETDFPGRGGEDAARRPGPSPQPGTAPLTVLFPLR